MISLAVPVVLSELGWVAQGVVDNIMVGRLGPAAIGAVAVGNAFYYNRIALWNRPAAGPRHPGIAGLRAPRLRRVPPLAGAGCLSGLHRHSAGDDPDYGAQLRLHASRRDSRSSEPLGWISPHRQLGNAAAAALCRDAAVSAGRGPGARDHADLRAGKSPQLGRQLGIDQRQARFSGPGRERIGDFDLRVALCHGSGDAGLRVEIRTESRTSAVRALGCAAGRSAAEACASGRAGRRADTAGGWGLEPEHVCCGLSHVGRAGRAYHRAELCQHLLHGAAWHLVGCCRQRRTCDWRE